MVSFIKSAESKHVCQIVLCQCACLPINKRVVLQNGASMFTNNYIDRVTKWCKRVYQQLHRSCYKMVQACLPTITSIVLQKVLNKNIFVNSSLVNMHVCLPINGHWNEMVLNKSTYVKSSPANMCTCLPTTIVDLRIGRVVTIWQCSTAFICVARILIIPKQEPFVKP